VRHTRRRVSLNAVCNASIAASSKRRQKSRAVVGSGIRWAPSASRYTSSWCAARYPLSRCRPTGGCARSQHVIRFVIRQAHLQHLDGAHRAPPPTPCAAPTDASRRSRHWRAHASCRRARSECCSQYIGFACHPCPRPQPPIQSVGVAAPLFRAIALCVVCTGQLLISTRRHSKCPPCVRSFWFDRRETLT
jgi:uncharacterized CHY-type Zn-finger protein